MRHKAVIYFRPPCSAVYSQKGFRRGHSVANAQSTLTNCMQAAKIEGRPMYMCFLDLKKLSRSWRKLWRLTLWDLQMKTSLSQ